MPWTTDELDKIAATEELHIATLRRDGTLRASVTIWMVRVGDNIYVRSVKGRDGPWFKGTLSRHEGHIRAGGVDKDVAFEDADEDVGEQVDAAFRSKYRRYSSSIVDHVMTPEARAATIRIVPR